MDVLLLILADGQNTVWGGALRGALIGGAIGLAAGAVIAVFKKKKPKDDSTPGPE